MRGIVITLMAILGSMLFCAVPAGAHTIEVNLIALDILGDNEKGTDEYRIYFSVNARDGVCNDGKYFFQSTNLPEPPAAGKVYRIGGSGTINIHKTVIKCFKVIPDGSPWPQLGVEFWVRESDSVSKVSWVPIEDKDADVHLSVDPEGDDSSGTEKDAVAKFPCPAQPHTELFSAQLLLVDTSAAHPGTIDRGRNLVRLRYSITCEH